MTASNLPAYPKGVLVIIQQLRLGLLICAVVAMAGLAKAQSTQPSTTRPATQQVYSDQALRAGAERTYVNYNRAWQAGTETDRTQIAQTYWTDEIKFLQPVRVYLHAANVVVVQKTGEGTESGKYLTLMISSVHPTNGRDGFEYTPNPRVNGGYSAGTGVFNYTRKIQKP